MMDGYMRDFKKFPEREELVHQKQTSQILILKMRTMNLSLFGKI
jgi:hypothetical protein